MDGRKEVTVGAYIAARLSDIGIEHYFAVPGDYNLVLLDELLENPSLTMIGCCNELNAGYAADGYARAHGAAAQVVTFSVGGLSALNAVAGAYAEDLPLVIISGGPNTNSQVENQILHHTCGEVRYGYQRDIFAQVTAAAVVIRHLADAPFLIDRTIETCLSSRKPVYIEVPCNLAGRKIPAPRKRSFGRKDHSHEDTLAEAVDRTAELLSGAAKAVLVAGGKLKHCGAVDAFMDLVDASKFAAASMPVAKGVIPESHPNYIGTYWGPVSSPGTAEIVESANVYLFAGAVFTDYTTSGYSTLINPSKLIHAGPGFVKLPDALYDGVNLSDYLEELSKKVKPNDASLVAYERIKLELAPRHPTKESAPITTRRFFERAEEMLSPDMTVLAETGDSWFNTMKMRLPDGCGYEIQMQYGSIGWSVGATLGYTFGSGGTKRVVAFIGDGSFQLTAQEVSTMIRYGLSPIIFLINNGGYTIEVEIHDGPYNNIKNWDYAGLVDVFNAGEGNGWSAKVRTEGDLDAAIEKALSHDGLSLIEVIVDRDDCSKELLEWGSRVSANNGRPPLPSIG